MAGRYNRENWARWVKEMRTTPHAQTTGRLGNEPVSGNANYCCLGLGSELVPNIQRIVNECICNADPEYGEECVCEAGVVSFGTFPESELAPPEFLRWLGLHEFCDQYAEVREGGSDIQFDVPHGLTIQGADVAGRHKEQPSLRRQMTAAQLNDGGFTFAQIADVAAYFGPGVP